jgi:AcrR family transcriptional regulator
MKIDPAALAAIHELHASGRSATDIANLVGCSVASVYRVLGDQDVFRSRARSYVKDQRQKFRARIQAIKLEAGCADCHYNGHPAALDFDHLAGTEKMFTIGSAGSGHAWRDVLLEIAKCDVVCANCHRIRTDGRGWGTNHR